jgi:hypothetical protein
LIDLENTIFLTFDLDWACDEVFLETIKIIENNHIPATFFITHETNVLDYLRSKPDIELGIHPNFNNLLNGNFSDGNINDIVKKMKTIVPEAVSVRSHSLAQSSRILDTFSKFSLTHDVNLFIPAREKIKLTPIRHLNNLIRIPYFWEDDFYCVALKEGFESDWNVNRFLAYPGLKVFDFHPIHVFLNTEDLERYEKAKIYNSEPEKLINYRYNEQDKGTKSFLENLIKEAKLRGIKFGLIRDILHF